MSTSAVVGYEVGSGSWVGSYVHWDGMPDGLGPVLTGLIARNGLAEVVQTVVVEHPAWSWLELDPEPRRHPVGRFVPGYGEAYDDGETPRVGSLGQPLLGGLDFGYIFTARDGDDVALRVLGACGQELRRVPVDGLAGFDWKTALMP